MAPNLAAFKNTNYIGTPYGQSIAIGVKPLANNQTPKTVRIDIPWYTYGASTANQQISVSGNLFQQNQQVSPLDFIRSVFIDNLYVNVPVYVQFPDTLHTIVCPPNSQAMHPVFTYQQQFTIFGDGFEDGDVSTTSLFFSNIDRQGYYVPGSIGGETPGTAVLLNYAGSYVNAGASGWTWPGITFGAEDTDRVIIVAFDRACESSYSNISTVTIGGVGATLAVRRSFGSYGSEIWYALVPTGTSGSIVVGVPVGTATTFGGVSVTRNLQSPNPIATGGVNSPTASAGSPQTISISAQNNGVVIGAATKQFNQNFGWIGLGQNGVANIPAGSNTSGVGAAASALITANSNLSITSTCLTMVAASFR